ncbi:lysozyme inhibitor LprI family protein [Clostridium sp.]|uniref:lysozyme inhibitor LprI family protein n=1 Tax=Clostridium sp. TaxID=1506 RepID=UPI0025BCDD8E|nr:lysozyme inhibitor LprI family protein [Clostridium sp.]
MKAKKLTFMLVVLLLIIPFTACSKDNEENQNSKNEVEENQQMNDDINNVDNSDTNGTSDSSYNSNNTKINETTQEPNPADQVTQIEGKRKEFIEKLDNIQKELDSLPEKKDSDAGITIAMTSYYGVSYDMYDKALNEIYALLKEQLSPETMQNLQSEQIKWIEEKEATAKKDAEKYKGGTFEFVAYNSSLYGTTKNRCYELVNNYMTD